MKKIINKEQLRDLFVTKSGSLRKKQPNLDDYDYSHLSDLSYLFANCHNLINAPSIDLTNVTDSSYMFYNCINLLSADNLNTDNITNMCSMFYNCQSISSFTFSSINEKSNINLMFSRCRNLTSIDILSNKIPEQISSFETFQDCISLHEQIKLKFYCSNDLFFVKSIEKNLISNSKCSSKLNSFERPIESKYILGFQYV
jgi:hypothetical protein